jgi:hypothetical protein
VQASISFQEHEKAQLLVEDDATAELAKEAHVFVHLRELNK